jgi:cell division protein FtsL
MTTTQRPSREPDLQVRRSMARALGVSAAVVALTLGLVGLKIQELRLSYRLDTLRDTQRHEEELNRQLRVELATLRSPSRIEAHARELGLVVPAADQVRLAREFAPDGPATSSTRVAQTRPSGRVAVR